MDLPHTLEEADLEPQSIDSDNESRSSSNSLPRHPSNSLNFLSEHSNDSLASSTQDLSPPLQSHTPSPPNEPTELKQSNTSTYSGGIIPAVISNVGSMTGSMASITSMESKNSALYDHSTTRPSTDSPQLGSRSCTITPAEDRERTVSGQRLPTTVINEEMILKSTRSPTPDAGAIPAINIVVQPSPRTSRTPHSHSHGHSHYRKDDLATVNIHESPQQIRTIEQQLQAEHEERSAYHRMEDKAKFPHSRPIDVAANHAQPANRSPSAAAATAATRQPFIRALFGGSAGSTTPTSITSRSITPPSLSAASTSTSSTATTFGFSHAHSLPSSNGIHIPPPALPSRPPAVHGSASFSHFTGAAASGPQLPRTVDDDDASTDDITAKEIYANAPRISSFPEAPASPTLSASSPSLSLRFTAQNKPLTLRQSPVTALFSTYGLAYLVGCAAGFFGVTFGLSYWLLRPLATLGIWTSTYASSFVPVYADILISLFGLVFFCSILSTPLLRLFISQGWIVPVDEVLLASGAWRLFPLTVKSVWRRALLLAVQLIFLVGGASLLLLMIGCSYGWFDEHNITNASEVNSGQSTANIDDGFVPSEQHCSLSGHEYMWMKSIWSVVLAMCVFPLVFLASLNRHTLPSKIYTHFLAQHHLNFHDVANTGN